MSSAITVLPTQKTNHTRIKKWTLQDIQIPRWIQKQATAQKISLMNCLQAQGEQFQSSLFLSAYL